MSKVIPFRRKNGIDAYKKRFFETVFKTANKSISKEFSANNQNGEPTMKDVMVDIETLSTKNNAVVLAIGAIKFNPTGDTLSDPFYVKLAIPEQQKLDRHIDGNTVLWWMQQNDQARREFYDVTNMEPVMSAISKFNHYCEGMDRLWGNGSNFDNVILRSLWDDFEAKFPIPYWGDACYRTIRSVARNIGATDPEINEDFTAHRAVDDAYKQAILMQHYVKHITGAK